MVLTAEQHSQIATTYEKAAVSDGVPPQQRAAFARKAKWFRMLAQIGAKKQKAEKNCARRPWDLRFVSDSPETSITTGFPSKNSGERERH
jgi:hypothetical protein